MEDSAELCGIPGLEDEPVTKRELNRLAAEVKAYHYRPMKQSLGRMEQMLEKHIASDEAFHNKLLGAKWALWAIAGILSFLAPLVWQLIQALKTVGVL